ncbi:MAG: tRNA uracil 4-sulfurtransferase ThiI [bacterium]
MTSHFLIRYGEIALKGANQRFFQETLIQNLRRSVEDLGSVEVRHSFGRIIVDVNAEPADAADRLRRVFGVVSMSPVRIVAPSLDAIIDVAVAMVQDTLVLRPHIQTFKVDTRRADKRFPTPSMAASSEIGAAIRQRFPELRAQMKGPDLLVEVEIRDAAYIATQTIPGPGGLPTSTGGTALALLSGGIDSPVAAWLVARRGMTIVPVYFHSFPFTSDRAKEKVIDLCRVLAAYAGPLSAWVVFFTEIQRAIQLQVPEALRVLAMRRMMMRISDVLATRERAQALITGESVGQVASQTVESIAVINAATRLPILRPLIGSDKTEIVARAEAIGTYEISIRPFPDCCSLFVPAHPRTHPTVEELEAAESTFDIGSLVHEAVERGERVTISAQGEQVSAVAGRPAGP